METEKEIQDAIVVAMIRGSRIEILALFKKLEDFRKNQVTLVKVS